MTDKAQDKAQNKKPLKEKDAESGAPEETSIAGEEDPGAALEDWITRDERTRRKPKDKSDD
ncbi:hypothetical protein IT774_10770 [Salinimonas marina]|uniref:Uncharacterized protein n=1 Tax=Salinimonas marina TaxID=2785918 RepID=A0A7S9HCP7_9ALTE|nr:hypothetical protein [Salinimonas marina]QPG04696.1 hypothetical protein IT774_10770 [Salinimonas marina]